MTYQFVSHLVRFANIPCQAPDGLQGASVLENQTECNNVVVRSKHSFSFTLEFGTPENDKRWHTARHTLVLRLLRALPVHALIDGENLWTKLEKVTSMRIVRYLFLQKKATNANLSLRHNIHNIILIYLFRSIDVSKLSVQMEPLKIDRRFPTTS